MRQHMTYPISHSHKKILLSMHVPLNMSCFQLSFISVCRWPFAWFWKYYIKHVFAQKIICIWITLDAIYVHVLSSSLMSKSLLFHHRFHSFLIVIVWWIFHYVVDVDILNIWFFLRILSLHFSWKWKILSHYTHYFSQFFNLI